MAFRIIHHNPTLLGNTCILNIHLILSLETFCYCCSSKVKVIIACVENCIYEITNKIPKLNSLSLNTAAPTSQFIAVNVTLIDPVKLTKCIRVALDSSHSLAHYSNHRVFDFPSRCYLLLAWVIAMASYVLFPSRVSTCSSQIIDKKIICLTVLHSSYEHFNTSFRIKLNLTSRYR